MAITWKQFRHKLEFLTQRKRAYQLAFGTSAGEIVLQDLMKFCRYADTCFDPDPRLHAVAEGRREVLLRILNHMHREPDQLYQLYDNSRVIPQEVTNDAA